MGFYGFKIRQQTPKHGNGRISLQDHLVHLGSFYFTQTKFIQVTIRHFLENGPDGFAESLLITEGNFIKKGYW